MAMKNVTLSLFFLRDDEGYNLLKTEHAGEEDGAAVDGKGDDKADHPVDIQLLDKEGDRDDSDQENDDAEPVATVQFDLQDALGEEVLQERRDGLHAEAGAGRSDGFEPRDDNEIQQDVDDHASRCHKVELFQTAVGGEQGAEDVGCRQTEETTH